MCTFHRPAADIEVGTNNLIYAESFDTHGGTNDIHDCVSRSHLVEVNGFHRDAVYFGLSRAQSLKGANSRLSGRLRDRCC